MESLRDVPCEARARALSDVLSCRSILQYIFVFLGKGSLSSLQYSLSLSPSSPFCVSLKIIIKWKINIYKRGGFGADDQPKGVVVEGDGSVHNLGGAFFYNNRLFLGRICKRRMA